MSNDIFEFCYGCLKWFALSIAVGLIGGVVWAIIFWNSDGLFMYHWLAVPVSMVIMAGGGIYEWVKLEKRS